MHQHYNILWLKEALEKDVSLKFLFFWGHTNKHNETVGKFVFSQWYESPFVVEDITYLTAEHWMMAQKALLFDDLEVYRQIVAAVKPGEVKELGRQVKSFDNDKWNEHRYEIVKTGNLYKFTQHPALAKYLLETGDRVLVEASPVDAIWGIGLSADSAQVNNVDAWRGLNLLGFALMEVRDTLRAINSSRVGFTTYFHYFYAKPQHHVTRAHPSRAATCATHRFDSPKPPERAERFELATDARAARCLESLGCGR